ncbi:hypothetical protein BV898_06447 [Hypsibius exemplaris]|uniref:Methyltransferase domain-containing protein n=1 Tax=Hypsibius exemplaris TaxID=2072580 RepID=A0A1W0WW91_HYPEX|nr:hypothetical protein BV898_06447 [Hypsibius exemplaris]
MTLPEPEVIHAGGTFATQTLNNLGCQYNYNDEYVKAFVEYAGKANGRIADLGCGYGASTKRMLDAGAAHVIANDLSKEQLDIFYKSLDEKDRRRVELIPGNALELGDKIPANSLAGIFAASWLNFLQPEEIQRAMKVFYDLMLPGGKLCILTASCYSDLMETAQDVVSARKAAGDTWPGLWSKKLYSGPFAHHLPEFMHCLDPDVLEREAKAVGFKIEKAGYIDFGSVFQALKVDGREWAGLLAVKP